MASRDTWLLTRVRTAPVLTVGDDTDFLEQGGIINLRTVDGRVRFEINLAQARHVGLSIDSQLLRLAQRVVGGRP